MGERITADGATVETVGHVIASTVTQFSFQPWAVVDANGQAWDVYDVTVTRWHDFDDPADEWSVQFYGRRLRADGQRTANSTRALVSGIDDLYPDLRDAVIAVANNRG